MTKLEIFVFTWGDFVKNIFCEVWKLQNVKYFRQGQRFWYLNDKVPRRKTVVWCWLSVYVITAALIPEIKFIFNSTMQTRQQPRSDAKTPTDHTSIKFPVDPVKTHCSRPSETQCVGQDVLQQSQPHLSQTQCTQCCRQSGWHFLDYLHLLSPSVKPEGRARRSTRATAIIKYIKGALK